MRCRMPSNVHETLVATINGVARLRSSAFRNVEVGAKVRELTEGADPHQHVVLGVGTAEVRTKADAVIVKPGAVEPESPIPGSQPVGRNVGGGGFEPP
jgi:hypothetical protein